MFWVGTYPNTSWFFVSLAAASLFADFLLQTPLFFTGAYQGFLVFLDKCHSLDGLL